MNYEDLNAGDLVKFRLQIYKQPLRFFPTDYGQTRHFIGIVIGKQIKLWKDRKVSYLKVFYNGEIRDFEMELDSWYNFEKIMETK